MTDGNVLLVESDVLVRHPLAEYLRECGFTVFEAGGETEARALLSASEVKIDIVLAEGEGNFALAGWLRLNRPDVRVLRAGSVARATEKAGELCEEGPAEILPYEHKFLLERIRKALAERERRD